MGNLTTETNVATTMSDEFEVPAGTYGMAVVEMKMLVYRTNATGDKLFRLTYPTGQMIVGGFNKNDFNTQILDDSFMSIARNFGVKTYSEDDIMKMAMHVPTLNTENIKKSSIKLIDYNESYQLFNTVFKGSLLSSMKATKYKKSTVTCVTDTNNYEWSFWQFERRPWLRHQERLPQELHPERTHLFTAHLYKVHCSLHHWKNIKLRYILDY